MSKPPSPLRIPETMGPSEIGPYFRELREYFKLSPQGVSERLHIRVRYVNAMEEGNFEQMPGKVYARGYIHTYAEFLGLDADQVVAQCFPELPMNHLAAQTASFTPAPRVPHAAPHASGKRWWMLGGLVLVAYVLYTQVAAPPSGSDTSNVAEVPESMLADIRDTVMPRARNYACLTGGEHLTCMMETESFRHLMDLSQSPSLAMYFTEAIDLSNAVRAVPPAPAPAYRIPQAVQLEQESFDHE